MPLWLIANWRVITGLAAVVAVIAVLSWVYMSGRENGQEVLRKDLQHQREKIEKSWNKIDRKPLAVDDAVKRLRKRSAEAGYSAESSGSSTGIDNELGQYLH